MKNTFDNNEVAVRFQCNLGATYDEMMVGSSRVSITIGYVAQRPDNIEYSAKHQQLCEP